MAQWYSQAENERMRFELEMALRENERLRLQLKMREDGEQHLLGEVEARDLEIARLGGPVSSVKIAPHAARTRAAGAAPVVTPEDIP